MAAIIVLYIVSLCFPVFYCGVRSPEKAWTFTRYPGFDYIRFAVRYLKDEVPHNRQIHLTITTLFVFFIYAMTLDDSIRPFLDCRAVARP